MYDITRRSSFLSVPRWIEEIRRYAGSAALVALVGNKSDLKVRREVEFAEVEAVSQFMPEVLFVLEASAKDNNNIEDAFMYLAAELKVRLFIWF